MAQYVYLVMMAINFLILDAGNLGPCKPQEVVMCFLSKELKEKKKRKIVTGHGRGRTEGSFLFVFLSKSRC